VGLSICNDHEPCKNSWTDPDAVSDVDSGGPKELCIRWGADPSIGRGNFEGRWLQDFPTCSRSPFPVAPSSFRCMLSTSIPTGRLQKQSSVTLNLSDEKSRLQCGLSSDYLLFLLLLWNNIIGLLCSLKTLRAFTTFTFRVSNFNQLALRRSVYCPSALYYKKYKWRSHTSLQWDVEIKKSGWRVTFQPNLKTGINDDTMTSSSKPFQTQAAVTFISEDLVLKGVLNWTDCRNVMARCPAPKFIFTGEHNAWTLLLSAVFRNMYLQMSVLYK